MFGGITPRSFAIVRVAGDERQRNDSSKLRVARHGWLPMAVYRLSLQAVLSPPIDHSDVDYYQLLYWKPYFST
jgi:hypothetical protein